MSGERYSKIIGAALLSLSLGLPSDALAAGKAYSLGDFADMSVSDGQSDLFRFLSASSGAGKAALIGPAYVQYRIKLAENATLPDSLAGCSRTSLGGFLKALGLSSGKTSTSTITLTIKKDSGPIVEDLPIVLIERNSHSNECKLRALVDKVITPPIKVTERRLSVEYKIKYLITPAGAASAPFGGFDSSFTDVSTQVGKFAVDLASGLTAVNAAAQALGSVVSLFTNAFSVNQLTATQDIDTTLHLTNESGEVQPDSITFYIRPPKGSGRGPAFEDKPLGFELKPQYYASLFFYNCPNALGDFQGCPLLSRAEILGRPYDAQTLSTIATSSPGVIYKLKERLNGLSGDNVTKARQIKSEIRLWCDGFGRDFAPAKSLNDLDERIVKFDLLDSELDYASRPEIQSSACFNTSERALLANLNPRLAIKNYEGDARVYAAKMTKKIDKVLGYRQPSDLIALFGGDIGNVRVRIYPRTAALLAASGAASDGVEVHSALGEEAVNLLKSLNIVGDPPFCSVQSAQNFDAPQAALSPFMFWETVQLGEEKVAFPVGINSTGDKIDEVVLGDARDIFNTLLKNTGDPYNYFEKQQECPVGNELAYMEAFRAKMSKITSNAPTDAPMRAVEDANTKAPKTTAPAFGDHR